MDMMDGFYRILMRERDIPYTAMSTLDLLEPIDAEIPDTCSLTHLIAWQLPLGPRLVPRLRSSPVDLFSAGFCYGERWAQFRIACTTSVPIVLAEEGKLVPRRD